MSKVKPLPKILLACTIFSGLFYGVFYAKTHGMLGRPDIVQGSLPTSAVLPELKQAPTLRVTKLPLPSAEVANSGPPKARIFQYAWNAHSGLILANGGNRTTKGSLMAQAGVDLELTREDNNDKLLAALVTSAKSDGKDGASCITLMGDGTPAFLSGAAPILTKEAGSDSAPIIVGAFGFSRGEDGFWGPREWIRDPGCADSVDAPSCQHPDWGPKKARGALVAGVLRDGDWNIALKWAIDNGLSNNPDETTWDPDRLNWLGTDSYTGAGGADEKWITGACVDRRVIQDGKPTGATKKVCVNSVVTWTPGDVNIAKKKGGLVPIVTTREYSSQMPCTLLCVGKWARANRSTVTGILKAAFQAADQIRAYPEALHKAAQLSAVLYKEETPEYWERYYHGVTETDSTGTQVALGGSAVINLNDNLNLFGLVPGSADVFGAVYTVFGDIQKGQYPKLIPSYPKSSEVVDTSFLMGLAASAPTSAPADVHNYSPATAVKQSVSKRSWQVTFLSGSASFDSAALKTLEEISASLLTNELAIELHGHTDNTGDPASNIELSRRRAEAVKNWLMKKSSTYFPADRFSGPAPSSVFAHGQTKPISNNSTPDGQSRNRRVDIVLGVQ